MFHIGWGWRTFELKNHRKKGLPVGYRRLTFIFSVFCFRDGTHYFYQECRGKEGQAFYVFWNNTPDANQLFLYLVLPTMEILPDASAHQVVQKVNIPIWNCLQTNKIWFGFKNMKISGFQNACKYMFMDVIW